ARREQLQSSTKAGLPFSEVISYLIKRRGMYLSHFLGMSTVAMLTYAMLAWIPTMFMRTWDWKISEIGLAYGIVTLAAGPLSAVLSPWLGERLDRKQYQDSHMRAVIWILAMALAGAV